MNHIDHRLFIGEQLGLIDNRRVQCELCNMRNWNWFTVVGRQT